jgi:beta-N-acetylhexosaminidase
VTTFQLRRNAVLHAEGNRALELGRHFIVGYPSFDEIAPLAAKGLIGGMSPGTTSRGARPTP